MSRSIIFIDYQINKAEITAKYCVNKDKPQMHCCGKCLLKKKLAEQEEQQKFPAFPDLKTDIQLYYSDAFVFLNIQNNSTITIVPQNISVNSLKEGSGIFHPPSLA